MSGLGLALRRAAARREPATALAALRIALGLCLMATLALSLRGRALDVLWLSPSHGGMLPLSREHWIHALLPDDEGRAMHALFWLTSAGALMSTLGLGGRVMLLATQQCLVAWTGANPDVHGGADTLLAVGFLLLACSACASTLSLDCWLAHRRWTHSRLCFAWPRYAFIVQLLFMYGSTGLQKLGLPWTPLGGYSALYYVLSDPTWIRWDFGELRPYRLVLALATALTWHWEQFAPLLFVYYYYRATKELPGRLRRWCLRHDPRTPFAIVGGALHLGIFALLDVGLFSLLALSYYISLWSPADWREHLRRVGHRGRTMLQITARDARP
jgi:hypothetical protein